MRLTQGEGFIVGTMFVAGIAALFITAGEPPPPQPAASISVPKPFDRAAALQNPTYRAAMQAQQEIEVRGKVRDLPQWMDLPPQSHEEFVALLTRQGMESMERKAAREQQRGKPAGPRLPSVDLRHQEEVARLLGEKRLAQWKDYQQTATQRKFLAEMDMRLPAGEKLAPAKVPEIARAMRQAERDFWTEQQQRPGSGQPGVPAAVRATPGAQIPVVNRQTADRATAAASRYLTRPQLDLMYAMIEEKAGQPLVTRDRRPRVRADLQDFRYWADISDATFERLVDLGVESGMGSESLEPLLGEENMRRFREWMFAAGMRYHLAAMNSQLPHSEVLAPQAAARVATAMLQAQQDAARELGAMSSSDARINQRALAAAAPHLTALQQQALDRTLRAATLMVEARNLEAGGEME